MLEKLNQFLEAIESYDEDSSNAEIKFVYDVGGDLQYAPDAVAHFIYGSKEDDNLFSNKGFYKTRVVDNRKTDEDIYTLASEDLLNHEEKIIGMVEGKDKNSLLDYMKSLEAQIEELIAGEN